MAASDSRALPECSSMHKWCACDLRNFVNFACELTLNKINLLMLKVLGISFDLFFKGLYYKRASWCYFNSYLIFIKF